MQTGRPNGVRSSDWLGAWLVDCKFTDDGASKILIDLGVTRNWLASFGSWVLIPIMLATVANENSTLLLQGADQIASLHANSSSACWRTAGMAPDERSR